MAEQQYILDSDGNRIRRVKIARGIKPSASQDIERIDVYRLDDDDVEFRTSLSLDGETFAMACAIHGGAGPAREWLRDEAERLWEEDRLARHAMEATGGTYAAELSVSREVQRLLLEAATAHLHGLRRQTGAVPPPGGGQKPQRRTAQQRATQFAAYQQTWRAAYQAAHAAAYQQAHAAGAQAGLQAGQRDGWDDGFVQGKTAAAKITGELVSTEPLPGGGHLVSVIAGEFAGMSLPELAAADVILVVELLRTAEMAGHWTDHGIILAWLDQHHPTWREAQVPEAAATEMETARAWKILGLPPGSGRDLIAQARTRLLRKIHPDVGGSDELATLVNAAADHLIALEEAP